jgi:hypothetical protein
VICQVSSQIFFDILPGFHGKIPVERRIIRSDVE